MPHPDDSVQPKISDDPPQQQVNPSELDGSQAKGAGKVFLVGAGPGDPRLITVRGQQVLASADFVLYDGLANRRVLDFAVAAQQISVGKHGKQPLWSQSEINDKLVELAQTGKRVVRLKGGDPAIFGRTSEELEALRRHGIPFEVVPGITAALAVACYAGIPLTHRDYASAVALVTGQQQDDAPYSLDWANLAKFPGTLVVYMGVTTAAAWTSQLIQHGKSPETDVAIVRRCSWPDQRIVRCKLNEVAGILSPASSFRPPVLVVVGPVASLGQQWNWFAETPLHGQGIWVPRPAGQADSIELGLLELGAEVFAHPAVTVERPRDTRQLEGALQAILQGQIDGITFSSANGVDRFMQALWERLDSSASSPMSFKSARDVRILSRLQIACVGPATAQRLHPHGLRADFVASEDYSASTLLEVLSKLDFLGTRWIVTSSNRSHDTLAAGLREFGANVEECLAYEVQPVSRLPSEVAAAIDEGRLHQVVLTSRYLAQVCFELLGNRRHAVQSIAMGQAVAQSLEKMGWPPKIVSKANSVKSLIQALSQGASWEA